MQQLIRILEWPIGWMQKQIEQISSFLWNFYLCLFMVMVTLSSVTTRLCVVTEREGDTIRASSSPVIQSLAQLNDLTSHVKK